MGELIAVTYPDVYEAGEVCAAMQRLHEEFRIEIEDISYVTRDSTRLYHSWQLQPAWV
jgi:uncharacterized membrane protein